MLAEFVCTGAPAGMGEYQSESAANGLSQVWLLGGGVVVVVVVVLVVVVVVDTQLG